MLKFIRIAHFSFDVKNFNINDCINDKLIEVIKSYTNNYVEWVYKPSGSYFLKSIVF
jgi:hypothetical protein